MYRSKFKQNAGYLRKTEIQSRPSTFFLQTEKYF